MFRPRRPFQAALALAVALSPGLLPGRSAAQAKAPTLADRLSVARGQGAGDCPDAASLAAQVEPLLSGNTLPDVRVDVQIGKSEAGYEAAVRASGARMGRRTLADAGSSCAALSDALAVAVAMILDGRDGLPSPPAPGPSAPPVEAPGPPPASPAGGPWGRVVLGAEATAGLLARGSTGPAGEIALALPRGVELGLGASYLPPSTYAEPPGEVRVSLLTARARGCFLWEAPAGSLSVGVCALALGGRIKGEGQGYFRDHDPASAWGALGLGALARGALARDVGAGPAGAAAGGAGWLGWQAEIGALVPLRRQSFSVERVSDGPVFEQAPAGGFARLGLWAKIF